MASISYSGLAIFVKISYLLVCMAAICYSSTISAVPTNEKLIRQKETCAKFQIDISIYCIVYTLKGLQQFLLWVRNFVAKLIYPVKGINIAKQTSFCLINIQASFKSI